MPAVKLPTPHDAATARRILLEGIARDADVSELAGELAPLHPRGNAFPGHVFLHVAADALDWCQASRASPIPLEAMSERFLPECAFRGRQNKKLQFAVLAAAALHGGAEFDLLEEIAWWQTDDFWQYALYAAVAYLRAAAGRADVPARPGVPGTGPAWRPGARVSPPRKHLDQQAGKSSAGYQSRKHNPRRCIMARTWLSIRVDLVEGHGEQLWPRPGRVFAAARSHTFKQLADAIDDGFARWDRSHLQEFTLADGRRLCDPDPDWDSGRGVTEDYRQVKLSRLRPGEQFAYVFDLGDDWAHLCVVAEARIDPVEVLGILPGKPLPYWGWGDIPDQYGRRWYGDDGERPGPKNPGLADLPPLRPHWGHAGQRSQPAFTAR